VVKAIDSMFFYANKKGGGKMQEGFTEDELRLTTMDLWFEEKLEPPVGTTFRVLVNKTIERFRSEYQEIAVLETEKLGKMLILDGVIMLSEFDEFAYHEMIIHVPLLTHPNPKKVLVIGGGDGGSIREIVKHKEVEEVHLCEIDKAVVEVSKKYLPTLSSGFSDPRVKIFYEDGAKFVKDKEGEYDVIIVDSTDPVGAAVVLFEEPFYRDMYEALKPDGIIVSQCESIYYHQDLIKRMLGFISNIFELTGYYYSLVPTYPSGTIGFAFCSKKYHPLKDLDEKRYYELGKLRYYNPQIHKTSFCLPTFIRELLPPDLLKINNDLTI